jgi:hypothetical protein
VIAILPGIAFGLAIPAAFTDAYRLGLILVAGIMMLQAARPVRLVALAIFALMVTGTYNVVVSRPETVRSFFGVHKIVETNDGQFRILTHGTTIHGAMRIRTAAGEPVTGRPVPTTYYHAGGPLAQAIAAVREQKGKLGTVAIIGVGSGSLACYSRPGEHWTFYDIDPDIVRIARDPSRFRFLSTCAPDAGFVLGDARLTIADAPDHSIDLMVLDAFSSDAIPVHLITSEAIGLYASKLGPGGVAAIHISNRNMELASVVAAVAAQQGLSTWVRQSTMNPDQTELDSAAIVAVIARSEADIGALARTEGWHRRMPDSAVRPWTDDYANVAAAIWRKFRE